MTIAVLMRTGPNRLEHFVYDGILLRDPSCQLHVFPLFKIVHLINEAILLPLMKICELNFPLNPHQRNHPAFVVLIRLVKV